MMSSAMPSRRQPFRLWPTILLSPASPKSNSTLRPGLSLTSLPRLSSTPFAIPTTSGSTSAPWQSNNTPTRPGGWPAGRGAFVRANPTDTLALLKDLSAGVTGWIAYQSREDEGTQSPTQTLDRGWGSCRDFAVLFVEAARCLGFGARIVSGYLYNPDQNFVGSSGAGSTHAWAEIYVPGAGWITFDPTHRGVGGFNLIPVAVARDIRQTIPVAGSFAGMSDASEGMTVEVRVTL